MLSNDDDAQWYFKSLWKYTNYYKLNGTLYYRDSK
jgi:hypothetical protein